MLRSILDQNGIVIGELSLPDSTSEAEWAEKLSAYSMPEHFNQDLAINSSIKARVEYAQGLIEKFKFQNISQGINALQAMYLHHKMRALTVTFYGVPMTLDLLNMVVSGDIEIACLSLINCTVDDGSLPFHWLTAGRRDWLVADMKNYLGWS